jgi:hypothetical protein
MLRLSDLEAITGTLPEERKRGSKMGFSQFAFLFAVPLSLSFSFLFSLSLFSSLSASKFE